MRLRQEGIRNSSFSILVVSMVPEPLKAKKGLGAGPERPSGNPKDRGKGAVALSGLANVAAGLR